MHTQRAYVAKRVNARNAQDGAAGGNMRAMRSRRLVMLLIAWSCACSGGTIGEQNGMGGSRVIGRTASAGTTGANGALGPGSAGGPGGANAPGGPGAITAP